MNRQIGVRDSKYVVIFDPLPTVHVTAHVQWAFWPLRQNAERYNGRWDCDIRVWAIAVIANRAVNVPDCSISSWDVVGLFQDGSVWDLDSGGVIGWMKIFIES